MSGYTDGNSAQTQFTSPLMLSLLKNDLYVSEYFENRIRKIDLTDINNPISSTVAGSGTLGADNGIGIAANFNLPRILDNDGVDLFVLDGQGSTIRRLNPRTSEVTTVVGKDGACVKTDGLLSIARTCYPYWGIRTDDGIFIIDGSGFSIRWIH